MKIVQIILIVFLFLSCNEKKEVYRHYYPNGTLKEEYSMVNGKFNGKYKAFYSNGKLQAIGEFYNGKMNGIWQYYYDSGRKQSIQEYSNGKIVNINFWGKNGEQQIKEGNGVAIKYYKSEQIESIMSYRNSVLDGKCETWYPNGKKATELFYKKGKAVGMWLFWDENGKLIKIKKY
jgi:antitoxin component YwqK of YwqJK toxin-antitoxin module